MTTIKTAIKKNGTTIKNMGRKGYERISQREYGRRLGVSNETIRKAIEAGKINKGWDKKEGKIVFEIANEEWGNIYLKPNEAEQEAINHLKSIPPYNPDKAPAKTDLPKPTRQEIPIEDDETPEDILKEIENFSINARTPFAEAMRIEKVAKAKMAILDLKKATGELVYKDEVYKQLFAFGQEVRQALLVVPDRCIDAVVTAKNRSEAHVLLTKELHEALEKLTSANIDFQPRQ